MTAITKRLRVFAPFCNPPLRGAVRLRNQQVVVSNTTVGSNRFNALSGVNPGRVGAIGFNLVQSVVNSSPKQTGRRGVAPPTTALDQHTFREVSMARRDSSTLRSRYRKLRLPDGSRIDEHRYIMEQHLGRKLGRREVVHHKNDDPKDNRLENLEVMTLSQHSRMHAQDRLRRGIRPSGGRGERAGAAKLKEWQVLLIQSALDSGFNCHELGAVYGVSYKTVEDIRNRKSWRHIQWAWKRKPAA